MLLAQSLFKVIKARRPEVLINVAAPAWTLPLLERMPEVDGTTALPFKRGQLALFFLRVESVRHPSMLLLSDVAKDSRRAMSEVEQALFGIDNLNVPRWGIAAVTHVDYSARIQTVHTEKHSRYHALILALKQQTGCRVIVNTSFSVRGEIIVRAPEDVFRCFMGTEIEALAVGNCFLETEEKDPVLEPNCETAFELGSSSRSARLLGWTLLALIHYAMLSAVVFLVSVVLLQKQIIPDLPWIAAVQWHLYRGGARHIWHTQPDCVVFDQDLIYKPKEGVCRFDNIEFKTVLNFSAEGRDTGAKPTGIGIAVLGDSHAMGWGVEDEETFSAGLQRLSGRPVYNLAVASYGTVRELIRMEQSGLLDKVDTVVIQYCKNDLAENKEFQPTTLEVTQQKFAALTQAYTPSLSGHIEYVSKDYWFTFMVPLSSLNKMLFHRKAKDFSKHYQYFIDAFSRHDELKNKRIIVFYSNPHGEKFRFFPVGKDRQLPNLEFVDLNLGRDDYYRLDDHLTRAGHDKAAQRLFALIQQQPAEPLQP